MQHYVCKIRDRCVRPFLLDGQPVKSFRAPATTKGVEKIYVIMHAADFCYVGLASTPMASRMYTGFHPREKTGYHGYAWKGLGTIDVHVWPTGLDRKASETIEAELVFLIRRETGRWPTFQTEIHFHNPEAGLQSQYQKRARVLFDRLKRPKARGN